MAETTDHVYDLVLKVDADYDARVTEAIEFLESHLIGEVPAVLTELRDAVSRTLWDGWDRDNVAVQIVGENGQPLTGEGDDLSPAEFDAIENEIEAMAAWENSPEGIAEIALQERLAAFLQAHREETMTKYRAWLEEQAERFDQARADWERRRRAELRAAFDAAEEEKGNP